MSKQLRVKVNNKAYDVEVGDLSASPVIIVVNGHEYAVEFEESLPVVSTPVVKTASAAAPVKAAPKPAPVPATPSAANGDAITAPMPGTIVEIMVKPGDKVTPGTPLCALEAMKMKNIIRSNHEGTIASIEVTEGQKVAYGAPLVRFA
jgi:biotin carboxyl carrier protein